MKKKTKENIIFVVITIVLSVALVLDGFFYFTTMPSESEQLKYSPFYVTGEWSCAEQNMTMLSYREDGDIVVKLKTEQGDFYLTYYSTRGFSHKYAVSIHISDENDVFLTSCHYNFEEETFSLFDFGLSGNTTSNNIFREFTSLNFSKV